MGRWVRIRHLKSFKGAVGSILTVGAILWKLAEWWDTANFVLAKLRMMAGVFPEGSGIVAIFLVGIGLVIWAILRPGDVPSGKTATVLPPPASRAHDANVVEVLNALIQEGDDLCEQMRGQHFHIGQRGFSVRKWLDSVNKLVWDVMPEHAKHITGEQGAMTNDEKLRYHGWGTDAAAMRISVDRRLARLREIRHRLQVSDKADSQSE